MRASAGGCFGREEGVGWLRRFAKEEVDSEGLEASWSSARERRELRVLLTLLLTTAGEASRQRTRSRTAYGAVRRARDATVATAGSVGFDRGLSYVKLN
ncbi:hypothetical protein IEQ34_016162 [Dendrobium chrysotoxum]|uniref:Uncharacterized protein n=1 Tax=Dendrobium chrysotoxum TaxID=161865 RepID=A0AAV7GEV1_DENCH|nr:hypothetical protein IEQ34_016162 [Dendrobium chrysotoxum]